VAGHRRVRGLGRAVPHRPRHTLPATPVSSADGGAEPPWQLVEQILLIVTDPRHVAVRPQEYGGHVTVLRARSYKTVAFPVLYLAPVVATPALGLTT
jgi:hypothetical protein